ncbi:phage holin family protein [Nocardioides sp. GCM10027113]|uniref:phage holin family protein n=1 Tax=unclassified Nocardioides TaxID=2615069 RepID=UPI003617DF0F
MRILSLLIGNAAALAAAAWLFEGIRFAGPSGNGTTEIEEKLLPLLVVAAIFTAVNAVVKPVLKLLSIPFIILTLGLFLLVINALMLQLTDWLAGEVGIDFTVTGFWTSIGGALVVTLVTWMVDGLIGERD